MSLGSSRRLDVWSDESGSSMRAGTLYVTDSRGVVTSIFEYDPEYLTHRGNLALGPDLPVESGRAVTKGLPGVMADSAPDRWGRHLISREMSYRSHDSSGTAHYLSELDFLIGVSDVARHGCLRYRDGDGPYLRDDSTIPLLVDLPKLKNAADIVARDDGDDYAAIKFLLGAGTSSLGGARPKASVRDGDRLLIAKFPHHHDQWDVMAWEKTALDIAERSGIATPPRQLVAVDRQRVLLLDRFDRRGGRRLAYMSAMSLLKAQDGEQHDYLEIIEALSAVGTSVGKDLAEMWRRIALSVALNNTDDHLRNHGFLRLSSGWTLSPIFDVNPNPLENSPRSTSLNFEVDRGSVLDTLFETAPRFGLTHDEAVRSWHAVGDAVAQWRDIAAANFISKSQCDRFDDIFSFAGRHRTP